MSANVIDALNVLAPGAEWTIQDPNNYSTLTWLSPSIPQPTEQQVLAQQAYMNQQAPIDACKAQAKSLLSATDWVEVPSVTDPSNNPHLTNQADFIAYRNALRALAVNPVANPTWPTAPTEKWTS
jgi:hypothetical protein